MAPRSSRSRSSYIALACLLLACLASTAAAAVAKVETSVVVPAPTRAAHHLALHRRKSSKKGDSTTKGISNDDSAATTMTASVQVATQSSDATASPLPQAFDGEWDSDLQDSDSQQCRSFVDSVFKNAAFEACYPLSLMLQTSDGFFNAERSLTSMVRVLDATCQANVTYCADFFNSAAKNLTDDTNCGTEWQSDDTLQKIYYGFQSYEMMYKATCLESPKNNMYCFATAATDSQNAADGYFYYLPYNQSLPASTSPSCGWCTQQTMSIFHAASADRSLPIVNTYAAAAVQVNTICGSNFVNQTLPAAESAAHSLHAQLPTLLSIAIPILGAAIVNTLL